MSILIYRNKKVQQGCCVIFLDSGEVYYGPIGDSPALTSKEEDIVEVYLHPHDYEELKEFENRKIH